jgi:hypothetical protein
VGKSGFFLSVIMISAVVTSVIINIHLYAVNNQLKAELSGLRIQIQDLQRILELQYIEFQTIEKGYFSRHKPAAYYVIQNEEEWTNVWNSHDIYLPQRSPPEVNFSETTIVAVFMEEFNTGGYGIEIKEIVNLDGSVIVKVEKTYLGEGYGVIEAFTYPYHIVKTVKIDKEITFETVEKTIECP